MTVVVPLGLWMIVRVGWIGVPLTDRSACGCFFFGAARVEGTAATARATVATTKAKARKELLTFSNCGIAGFVFGVEVLSVEFRHRLSPHGGTSRAFGC
jgi:hypothetical protein